MPEIAELKEKAHATEMLVEHWFFETFHGSVIARSTEVWNAVHAGKEELKRRLVDFLVRSDAPTD